MSFIIVILSTLAMFTPVFSGYVLGFAMLLMAIFTRFIEEPAAERRARISFQTKMSPISQACLIFWGSLVLAACLSAATSNAIDDKAFRQGVGNYCVKYVVLWFIYLSFWWRLSALKNLWRTFTVSYAVVALIHAFYCVLQRHYGFDWAHGFNGTLGPGRFAYGVYRISGFMGHPLTLGYSQTLAIVASLYFFRTSSERLEKIAWLVALLSSAVVILLSGSRGPQVVALIGAVLSVPPEFFRKQWRFAALCICIAAIFGWYFGVFARFLEFFNSGSGGDMRNTHWAVHWRIFLDHPWAGIGPGTFRSAISAYYFSFGANDNIKLAHNAFLQFAADYGVIGLTGFGVWISAWMRLSHQSSRAARPFMVLMGVTLLGALSQNNVQDSAFVLSLTIWTMVLAAHEVLKDDCSSTTSEDANLLAGESGPTS